MEDSAAGNERMITEPLLDDDDGPRKGGLRTMPFIIGETMIKYYEFLKIYDNGIVLFV